jgi:hypothetical protein
MRSPGGYSTHPPLRPRHTGRADDRAGVAPRDRAAASRRRSWLFLLVLFAAVAGSVAAEVLYRLKIGLQGSMSSAAAFTVLSEPLTIFDREFGYSYSPGRTVVSCRIQNGRVTSFSEVRIDSAGNLATDAGPPRDSIDVLIVGDSFTANPHQPLGWPHFYALRTGHRIHNYARDGYGLLQMVHLAAEKSREIQPDLVILAIIVEDVTRGRSWRSTVNVDGHPTAVVSSDPDRLDDPRVAMETALIDSGVTVAWCERQTSNPNADDQVMKRLTSRFRRLAGKRRGQFLLSPTRSLLVNRIRHHDPFHGLRLPSLVPQSELQSFEEDADFVRDFRSITAPLHLVVLPKHEELRSGTLLGSRAMVELLRSVKRVTGEAPTYLLKPVLASNADIERMFLLPADGHPSAYGSEVYGEAIRRVTASENGAPRGF